VGAEQRRAPEDKNSPGARPSGTSASIGDYGFYWRVFLSLCMHISQNQRQHWELLFLLAELP
jgi:hypothetical protein